MDDLDDLIDEAYWKMQDMTDKERREVLTQLCRTNPQAVLTAFHEAVGEEGVG